MELRERVQALLIRHAQGDVGAGNEAFSIAEELVRELLGPHVTFNGLLDAWVDHRYRPTLRNDVDPRAEVLADLYDYAQLRRGRSVEAYRGIAKRAR